MAVQVFGNESRFNEKVTFLKNVDVDGNLILGGNLVLESDISFGRAVSFKDDVTFQKNVSVLGNLSVTGDTTLAGITTLKDDLSAEKNVDVVGILTVREQLDVGVGGTFLRVDYNDNGVQVSISSAEPNSNSLFQINNLEASSLVFTDAGKLGIGTFNPGIAATLDNGSIDPTVKLDIAGSIHIQDEIYDSRNNDGIGGQFLSKDDNGIAWVSIQPQATDGINLMDEGIFVPTPAQGGSAGAAQTFSILNFVQTNSLGIGTDTLIPTARDPQSITGLATIFTQDLWGFVGSGSSNIYRMTDVGINVNNPQRTLDVDGTVKATGVVEFTSSIDVSSSTSAGLIVDGGVSVKKKLFLGDGTSEENSTSKTTGQLVIKGGVGISQDVYLGNDTDSTSSTAGGALNVTGGAAISKKLFVGTDLDVGATAIVRSSQGSSDNTSGALVVTGGLGLGENLNMQGNLDVDGTGKINSTQTSSNTITGALVVSGGVGIGEKLNVGNNTKIEGTLELDSSLIDVNNSTGGPSVGATDYRLASVGTGVSWRPPGVETKRTIWVTKNGQDSNSGLLEGDAKATLGGAAAVAQEGDTIKIRPGKYLENNPVGLRTDVSVTGEDLRLVTIVPQNKTDDVIHVRRGCLVENLSFAGDVIGAGTSIGCDGAGAVAFPPTQTDINAGISTGARSGFTGVGPADEGSSGRWRSPYIRNCTNFMTGSIGMKINGDHAVATDVGSGADLKSMVCDSFTQYNEAGIGVSLTNNAYAQLVSIFTINCDIGIFAGSGAQCDLTNSNTSFGNFGLVATGLGKTEFTGIASNTNVEGSIIASNNPEIDRIVLANVRNVTDNEVGRPFDGQALYFKIDLGNYPDAPGTGRITAPMRQLTQVNAISGADLTGFSALNPPTITILDGDTAGNPGGGPLGPQGIVAEATASVDETGKITEFNVISSGRNYLSTQNLIVDVEGNTGIATAVTEPIYFTVLEATESTQFGVAGGSGITTVTFNEFIPYEVFPDDPISLQRISRILTSSHSFEYVGTGTDINRATPLVGGVTIKANEIVATDGAQIPFTSTDQKGNFDIGEGIQIDQTTSTIRGRDFNRAVQANVTPLILALR
jgi:hypothetical protein